MSNKKWDDRFLDLAKHVSSWSKDPSTQVGAVLVSPDRKKVVLGYNGFPSAMIDDPDLLANRTEKYKRIVHAELNAILNAGESVSGWTLYTYPFMPCSNCAKLVSQAGVVRVVAPFDENPRWIDAFSESRVIFAECAVELNEVIKGN